VWSKAQIDCIAIVSNIRINNGISPPVVRIEGIIECIIHEHVRSTEICSHERQSCTWIMVEIRWIRKRRHRKRRRTVYIRLSWSHPDQFLIAFVGNKKQGKIIGKQFVVVHVNDL